MAKISSTVDAHEVKIGKIESDVKQERHERIRADEVINKDIDDIKARVSALTCQVENLKVSPGCEADKTFMFLTESGSYIAKSGEVLISFGSKDSQRGHLRR